MNIIIAENSVEVVGEGITVSMRRTQHRTEVPMGDVVAAGTDMLNPVDSHNLNEALRFVGHVESYNASQMRQANNG